MLDCAIYNSDGGWNGSGDVVSRLVSTNFDPRVCRPFIWNGRSYVSVQKGYKDGKPVLHNVPTMNAATLRKEDWVMIDQAVVQASRPRLKFFNELRTQGLNVNLPNALGKTVWQYERQSRLTGATVSMDGLRKSDANRPMYDMDQMPLPLIHENFSFSARQIAVSRNTNMPIDATTAAEAAMVVAEEVERLALGVAPIYSFGGGKVYGLLNYPHRLTKIFTNPWNADRTRNPQWTPGLLQREVLEARRLLASRQKYGPFNVYVSPDFDEILDDDYNMGTAGVSSSITLRERLMRIGAVTNIHTCEFLPEGNLAMVQMSMDTIQAVTGMDITTIQWQTEGGMEVHFKVLCMLLPRLRSDYYGSCGILHGALAPALAP